MTAEVNRDEIIRDSFITGLSSSNIHERLLENISLTLQRAIDQARSLESAHRNATQCQQNTFSCSALHKSLDCASQAFSGNVLSEVTVAATSSVKGSTRYSCFFCGEKNHD